LDDGKTLEVARLVTDGTPNACSALYQAAARIATEMGYAKIQTYILEKETGLSLEAAGWTREKRGCGGTPQGMRKNRPNGHIITEVTYMTKQRWARLLPANKTKTRDANVARYRIISVAHLDDPDWSLDFF